MRFGAHSLVLSSLYNASFTSSAATEATLSTALPSKVLSSFKKNYPRGIGLSSPLKESHADPSLQRHPSKDKIVCVLQKLIPSHGVAPPPFMKVPISRRNEGRSIGLTGQLPNSVKLRRITSPLLSDNYRPSVNNRVESIRGCIPIINNGETAQCQRNLNICYSFKR